MGNFYTNITLRGPDQERVINELRKLRRVAYISPAINQDTVVFDLECENQDDAILTQLARDLAANLDCLALAVLNHDDDILWLRLFSGSALLTEYVSRGGRKVGISKLCREFKRMPMFPIIWVILHLPIVLFELFRHEALVRSLGLPVWAVGGGYRYIQEGQIPGGLSKEQFQHT